MKRKVAKRGDTAPAKDAAAGADAGVAGGPTTPPADAAAPPVQPSAVAPDSAAGGTVAAPGAAGAATTQPRVPFGPDFPNVVIQKPYGSPVRFDQHPDYPAAKAGDPEAAARFVDAMIDPAKVADLRATIGDSKPTVVAVHAEEAAGRNAIPQSYAEALSHDLGLPLNDDIIQINQPQRTGQSGEYRLSARSEFDGPVQSGHDYLIVDDNVTQGGTLADLRSYIESRGGRVVAATALTGSRQSEILAPQAETLASLRANAPDLEPKWQGAFGHDFNSLTQGEANYLLRSPETDALGDRVIARGQARSDPEASGNPGPQDDGGGQQGGGGVSQPRVSAPWHAPTKRQEPPGPASGQSADNFLKGIPQNDLGPSTLGTVSDQAPRPAIDITGSSGGTIRPDRSPPATLRSEATGPLRPILPLGDASRPLVEVTPAIAEKAAFPRHDGLALLLVCAAALLWFVPFAWMGVASFRHNGAGAADLASLMPSGPFSWDNFTEAWSSGHFPLWYINTVLVCGGILIVQCVTVSLAGYAFARMRFPGQNTLFALFLLQLMLVPPILIVPNLSTLVALHLYDTLFGIMAPYCASAFGVFLMRQTFRTIPREYEEAALVDGASRLRIITHVLLPLSRPGLTAFAIVSVTSHWNEFLWPLMATSSPSTQVLTVGLATFAAGAEAGSEWGVIAAGTFFVAAPLLIAFVVFQRRFVSSFTFSGIK